MNPRLGVLLSARQVFGVEVLWCGDPEANGRRWSQWALERPNPGHHDLIPSFCNHRIPPTGSAALRMTVLGHPRSWSCHCLPVLILLLGIGHGPRVEGVTHYKPGDPVILYVNKVGPYHNPQETYHYYQLPVCCPEKIRHKSLSLAEERGGRRSSGRMSGSLDYGCVLNNAFKCGQVC